MSELIKHECGIAFIRLLKPLEYYYSKYSTSFYGLNKMYLLMEKQHNRGQDGAGLANIKIDHRPGLNYINRVRSVAAQPIQDVFMRINAEYKAVQEKNPELLNDVNWLKTHAHFTGEVFLGHLRYGTFGKNDEESLHPFIRANNWKTRSLVVAGNFNLTNVDELFSNLIELGQHPVETSDTITVMEKIGHFLDEEVESIFRRYREQGMSKKDITFRIIEEMDMVSILQHAAKNWDGGYAMAGMVGHGDAFILRDPAGIRPAFWYHDDEVVVAASERPVIQTAFNLSADKIKEVKPGYALMVKSDGSVSHREILKATPRRSCSFERIYFSRGSDRDIYKERKQLGKNLVDAILREINWDLRSTVFSYIPNTASVAFRGLAEGLTDYYNRIKVEKIMALKNPNQQDVEDILSLKPRIEKVAIKDVKMRTFITQDSERDDLVAHVYDITYGTIQKGKDTLVILDDSIVRGTTLKQSILRILDRLEPRKIVVVSSAPQIRYPDCYGIDMAKLGDFVAFRAAIQLLKDKKMESVINKTYLAALEEVKKPREEQQNVVRAIYEPFSAEELSDKIATLLTPKGMKAEVKLIYQSIEALHQAVPNDRGDWYFTGHYPTPGGNKVVNRSFINYIEGKNIRAY